MMGPWFSFSISGSGAGFAGFAAAWRTWGNMAGHPLTVTFTL
jgi:hypothetical protein